MELFLKKQKTSKFGNYNTIKYTYISTITTHKTLGRIKIVFIKTTKSEQAMLERKDNLIPIISTNTNLSDIEIINTYKKRWNIEQGYKDLEQIIEILRVHTKKQLDYFTGVLPTSQFGSESVVNLNHDSDVTVYVSGYTSPDTGTWSTANNTILPDVSVPVHTSEDNNLAIDDPSPIGIKHNHFFNGKAKIDPSGLGSLSIIALRNAIAVQRYKEIQLANDVDFQSQIEAHFGIKPNDKDENSLFIGGSSSMININE